MRESLQLPALILLMFSFAWLGCGGTGDGAHGGKKAPNNQPPLPDDEPTSSKYETNVGLNLLAAEPPRLAGCGKPEANKSVTNLSPFVHDGKFDEWTSAYQFISDRSGDGSPQAELIGSYLAYSGDSNPNLVGFLAGEFLIDADHQVEVTFGYLGEKREEDQRWVGPIIQRTYRFVSGGTIEERIGTEWHPLDPDTASWKSGRLGVEWTLNRRQLDEVLLQPLWFHQIKTVLNGELQDETGQRYVPAAAARDSDQFRLHSCGADTSSLFPLSFQQISETNIDPDAAEILFGVVRLAYESLQLSWNHESWPTQLLTVVVSTSPPIEDHTLIGADHRRNLYDGFVVQWSEALAEDLRFGRFANVFSEIQSVLVQGLLKHYRPMANWGELAWATHGVNQWTMRRYLSYASWLDLLPTSIAAFRASSDGTDPVGLLERYDRLGETFPTPELRESYRRVAAAKATAGAAIASLFIDPGQLITAWREAGRDGNFPHELEKTVEQREQVAGLWQGWLSNASYDQDWSPSLVDDNDHDGLLNFIEKSLGSHPDEVDSDADGWSDYGEFLIGTPHNNRSKVPGVIVADGYFGDWQELLPTRIQAHNSNVNSDVACGPESRIQASVGIGQESHLILAALPKQAWNGGEPISWEFQVNFLREDRQLIFLIRAGTYVMEVLDAESLEVEARVPVAVPAGYHATELSIDTRKFGINADLSRRRAARYRLTTILENGERLLCDQTPWLFPLAHASD